MLPAVAERLDQVRELAQLVVAVNVVAFDYHGRPAPGQGLGHAAQGPQVRAFHVEFHQVDPVIGGQQLVQPAGPHLHAAAMLEDAG